MMRNGVVVRRLVHGGLWGVLLVFFFGGCTTLKQPANTIDYYTLEYSQPGETDLKPLPVVVRVERFTVAPAYNTRRMVYQERPFVRNEYVYRQWRATPGDLVTFFLARDLRASGLFGAILPYDSSLTATHALEGTVDQFFERDSDDGWYAVLSMGVTLTMDGEPDVSKRILFQKNYHIEEPCRKKNPQGFAEAMSLAMKRISAEIQNDIYKCMDVDQ